MSKHSSEVNPGRRFDKPLQAEQLERTGPAGDRDNVVPAVGARDRLAYSVTELCAATSLSRSLIYEHIRQGRLEATKVNSRTVVLRDDALVSLQSMRG